MTRAKDSQNSPYIILNNQGEILPSIDLINDLHILGRDPQKADLLVPEQWGVVGRIQACFRKVGNDYYIYDGDGNKPSTNRLSIDRSTISAREGYRLQNGTEIKIGQNPSNWVILTYRDPNIPLVVSQTKIRSISLKNRSVMLGRDPSANLVLDAPTVSRKHAVIDTDSQGRYILQNYSPNGVFVNDRRVNDRAIIVSGSTIDIGPYILVLQGNELVLAYRGNNIRLDADNLVRIVKDKRGQIYFNAHSFGDRTNYQRSCLFKWRKFTKKF